MALIAWLCVSMSASHVLRPLCSIHLFVRSLGKPLQPKRSIPQSAVIPKRIQPICAVPQHICAVLSDVQHYELEIALLSIISVPALFVAYMRVIISRNCARSRSKHSMTAPAVRSGRSHCAS